MLGDASISFVHFVFRGPGRTRLWWAPGLGVRFAAGLLVASALVMAGCTRRSGIPPMEDTETSGRISIAASPDAQPLLAQEVAAFRAT